MRYFKDSRYLLIEAQDCHRKSLEKFAGEHAGCLYKIAAAGDEDNATVFFDDRFPLGGVASKVRSKNARTLVPMVTVDAEVKRNGLAGPYLLKMDTHGFETQILSGSPVVIASADLIVIEVYNFHVTGGSLLFFEMCETMRKLGFRPIDMCDPLWRPIDMALWQFDLFFIPSDRKEFGIRSYD